MTPAIAALLISCLTPLVYASPTATYKSRIPVLSTHWEEGETFLPNGVSERHFVECVREKYPLFPKNIGSEMLEREQINKCLSLPPTGPRKTGGLAARGTPILSQPKCSVDEYIREGDEKHNKVQYVFLEAGPFRALGQDFCHELKEGAQARDSNGNYDRDLQGIAQFGYAGNTAPGIIRGVKMNVEAGFKLSDHGKRIDFVDMCVDAFARFGTKGQGCTRELTLYLPSEEGNALTTTTTMIDGEMELFDKDHDKTYIGTLDLKFTYNEEDRPLDPIDALDKVKDDILEKEKH
ncbi:hypothetical protein FQN49_006097 [Arthroderma sp. PD_2]|nr:hypothetical protein FQN49_006097 [Arthroderma sp. PD_2]